MDIVSAIRQGIGVLGEAGIIAGEAAAVAAYPWLGWPIINQIFKAVVEKFADAAIKTMEDESTVLIVPVIDQAQANAASEASLKLQKDLEDSQTTQEELARDLDEWKQKYADLIHMRHATPN